MRPGFVSPLSLQARTCFTGTNVPVGTNVQTLTPEEQRRLMLLDHNLDKMLLKFLALPVQKSSANTDAEGAALAALSALQRRLMLIKLLFNHNISLLSLLVQKYKY